MKNRDAESRVNTENYTSPNAPAKGKVQVLTPDTIQLEMGTAKAELPKKSGKGDKKVK